MQLPIQRSLRNIRGPNSSFIDDDTASLVTEREVHTAGVSHGQYASSSDISPRVQGKRRMMVAMEDVHLKELSLRDLTDFFYHLDRREAKSAVIWPRRDRKAARKR